MILQFQTISELREKLSNVPKASSLQIFTELNPEELKYDFLELHGQRKKFCQEIVENKLLEI